MDNLYKIPADIYERVHEAVLAIVNASAAGDDILCAAHYEQLREFCELETAAGRGSGFMWEALADVTDDSAERLAHYQHALALAQFNAEPTHTILLELGRHYAEAGNWQRAQEFLIAARQQAMEHGDTDTKDEVTSLLFKAPSVAG